MNEFLLEITTPEGNVFSGQAVQISVRSVAGELAIMAGHVPFVATLVASECRVYMPDGEKKNATYEGGLLVVTKEKATMITPSFKWN